MPQLSLTCYAVLVAVGVGWALLHLVGDLTYEVRRDRARARAMCAMYQLPTTADLMHTIEWTGPVRLQQQRVKGWRTPDDAVRVSRGTDWGNPWKVGDLVPMPANDGSVRVTAELAVELFAAWVTERGWLDQMREELAGLDLVCWCKIGTPCHADWIVAAVNQPQDLADLGHADTLDVRKSLTHPVGRA